jgi:Tfp pilus assembly protein PilN
MSECASNYVEKVLRNAHDRLVARGALLEGELARAENHLNELRAELDAFKEDKRAIVAELVKYGGVGMDEAA